MFGWSFGNFFWGFSMLLHMLVPIILIILAVTLGMEIWQRFRKNKADSGSGPVLALKERYARGEISREEFLKIKEELSQV